MKLSRFSKAILIAVCIAAVLGLVGIAVMTLWNWLIPALFGGPVLRFWQAIGLLALTRILVVESAAGPGTGAGEGACGTIGSA
jgi:hypothetical protein